MQIIGWEILKARPTRAIEIRCQGCPLPATKKVTFADQYGKVILYLCDDCSEKDYFDITQQGVLL